MRLLALAVALVALSVPLAYAQAPAPLRGTVLCAEISVHPLSKRTYESGFVATGLGVMVFYVDYQHGLRPTPAGSRIRLSGSFKPALPSGRYFEARAKTALVGLDRDLTVRNVAVADLQGSQFAFGTVDRYGGTGSDCWASYSARQKPALTRAAEIVDGKFQKRTLALQVVGGQLRLVAIR
jgi:hypothetical protein